MFKNRGFNPNGHDEKSSGKTEVVYYTTFSECMFVCGCMCVCVYMCMSGFGWVSVSVSEWFFFFFLGGGYKKKKK